MKEQITITTTRFRDNLGRPTCACNFPLGEVCEFYRTRRFGVLETCIFSPGFGVDGGSLLERREDSNGVPSEGTTIPGNWCPLWKDEQPSH